MGVARRIAANLLAAFGKAFSSDLGKWFLTTVVVGLVVNGITQRNECLQTHDRDLLVNVQDDAEMYFMLKRFLFLTASAKNVADLQNAAAELEGRHNAYFLSANKGKGIFDLIFEHGIATNRWSGGHPVYFNDSRGADIFEFASQIIDRLSTEDIKEKDVQGIVDDAKRFSGIFRSLKSPDNGLLWDSGNWTVDCGFFEVFLERFRRTDARLQ